MERTGETTGRQLYESELGEQWALHLSSWRGGKSAVEGLIMFLADFAAGQRARCAKQRTVATGEPFIAAFDVRGMQRLRGNVKCKVGHCERAR